MQTRCEGFLMHMVGRHLTVQCSQKSDPEALGSYHVFHLISMASSLSAVAQSRQDHACIAQEVCFLQAFYFFPIPSFARRIPNSGSGSPCSFHSSVPPVSGGCTGTSIGHINLSEQIHYTFLLLHHHTDKADQSRCTPLQTLLSSGRKP